MPKKNKTNHVNKDPPAVSQKKAPPPSPKKKKKKVYSDCRVEH